MNPFLTTKQLARLLGVSVRHVYRQKAAGKLPRHKQIGRCVRWDPKDFQDWFDNGKNGKKKR